MRVHCPLPPQSALVSESGRSRERPDGSGRYSWLWEVDVQDDNKQRGKNLMRGVYSVYEESRAICRVVVGIRLARVYPPPRGKKFRAMAENDPWKAWHGQFPSAPSLESAGSCRSPVAQSMRMVEAKRRGGARSCNGPMARRRLRCFTTRHLSRTAAQSPWLPPLVGSCIAYCYGLWGAALMADGHLILASTIMDEPEITDASRMDEEEIFSTDVGENTEVGSLQPAEGVRASVSLFSCCSDVRRTSLTK